MILFVTLVDDQWRTHPISVFADKYRGENPEDRKLPLKVRYVSILFTLNSTLEAT